MEPLPRFITEPGSDTVYDTTGGYLTPIKGLDAFENIAGTRDFGKAGVVTAPNAQEYLTNCFRKQAESTYRPQLDQTLNGLDLNLQGINKAEGDTNYNFNNSANNLLETQNKLGLLTSGGTSDLTAKNESDRASALASLALQRAGITLQKAQAQTQTNQSINDMVSKLIAGSNDAKAAATQPAQSIDLGDRIILLSKTGQVVGQFAKGRVPGSGSAGAGADPYTAALLTGLLGGGDGGTTGASDQTAAPKYTLDQVKKELVHEFQSGNNYQGLDDQFIQRIQDATGVDKNTAASVFYTTRKPFENPNNVFYQGNQQGGGVDLSKLASLFPMLFQGVTNPFSIPGTVVSKELPAIQGAFNKVKSAAQTANRKLAVKKK